MVFNSKVYFNIIQRSKVKNDGLNSTQKEFKKDKNAAKALSILVIVFAICWTPYVVISLIYYACDMCLSDIIFTLSVLLVYANSSINPLLYAFINNRFKMQMKTLVTCGNYGSQQVFVMSLATMDNNINT